MIDPDTIDIKAGELRDGDLVDLESIPATADNPLAEYEFCEVLSVERDGDTLNVSINGVEPVVTLNADDAVKIAPRK